MSDVQLGKLAPKNADRDATHVAVVPMVAAERMKPGSHCCIVEPGKAGLSGAPAIGIVDPFLNTTVEVGQRFYLCLYPRTITGLRHVYEHPQLDAAKVDHRKAFSEQWLREFCRRSDCPDYDTVLEQAVAHQSGKVGWNDGYLHIQGEDAHGDIPPEFWEHVEVVTGQPMRKRASYFSCSC